MKKLLFAILTMLAVAFTAAADENATLKLKAHVVDGLTLEPVKRARVAASRCSLRRYDIEGKAKGLL